MGRDGSRSTSRKGTVDLVPPPSFCLTPSPAPDTPPLLAFPFANHQPCSSDLS